MTRELQYVPDEAQHPALPGILTTGAVSPPLAPWDWTDPGERRDRAREMAFDHPREDEGEEDGDHG